MRKLRIACILLLSGTVALLPLHQKVEGATGNYNAYHHQIRNSGLFTMAGGEQVPSPINIPNPPAALSAASGVCLVLDTVYVEGERDGRWRFGKGEASIKTENGESNYAFQIPERICPEGSSAKLKAQARASQGATLGARISLGGEVDLDPSGGEFAVATDRSDNGEVKEKSGTVTIRPSRGYSEGVYPVIKVWIYGGSKTLTLVFRYTVEQASNGGGMRLEYDTDRPGQDYKNFNLSEARPELCQAGCSADSNCRAFTYVKPGVQGPSARCWLKSGVPQATGSSCCVSGFKG